MTANRRRIDSELTLTRADVLAAVERSPRAAAAHDRAGWVELFTPYGHVVDPVGSRPHRGRAQIRRFYDTFIGPRQITFHRDADVVVGSTVIRDLELEVAMGSTLTLRIPAYLRYDVQQVGGEPRIAALYAFWELPTMVGQFLQAGVRSAPAGARLTAGLLRNQGVFGTAGFLRGLRTVHTSGKRSFAQFLDDACAGDEVAVRRRLADGALITRGDDDRIRAADLLTRLAGTRWRKIVGAGNTLVASADHAGGRDVIVAEVRSKPFTVSRVRYFSESGQAVGLDALTGG